MKFVLNGKVNTINGDPLFVRPSDLLTSRYCLLLFGCSISCGALLAYLLYRFLELFSINIGVSRPIGSCSWFSNPDMDENFVIYLDRFWSSSVWYDTHSSSIWNFGILYRFMNQGLELNSSWRAVIQFRERFPFHCDKDVPQVSDGEKLSYHKLVYSSKEMASNKWSYHKIV